MTAGRPCWVLETDGCRFPGWVLAWRRDGSGWRGLVRFSRGALRYEHWVAGDRLLPRPASLVAV